MKKLLFTLAILTSMLGFSQTSLLKNQFFDSTLVSSINPFVIYDSGSITTNPYEGLELTVKYSEQKPAFIDGQPIPFHNIHLVVEKEISDGVWVNFINQNRKFVKEENENTYNFQYDPSVINFDEGIPQILGNKTLSYKIRGRLPAKIRFKIILIDYKYNQLGAFESINIDLSYELYNL